MGLEQHIRHYRNGRDINQKSRDVMVIDLFRTCQSTRSSIAFQRVYQWILNRVKPERDVNKRETRRKNWWLFGETNPNLRQMLAGLSRYIATTETSKHRYFVFLDASILPDNMLVNIALQDAFFLGVLSSRIHVTWALATGGRLGVGNDPRYNKTRCFDPFPFPDCADEPKGAYSPTGRATRRSPQATANDFSLAEDDRHVQRDGQAPLRRAALTRGTGGSRAGPRLGS